MSDCIHVEFQPDTTAVPNILEVIGDAGFWLRGLRLIPCGGEQRATLTVELDGYGDGCELDALRDDLLRLESIIEVIHRAKSRR
ncbi:MAG: hypothetical protein JWN69_706 [Alphaproteobacteria bacterium]|nr:hypothetical protein [Alphaproteobacteria bacterium]